MPILRKQKHDNFTVVNNYFIEDINLKPDCKGILLYMLSKPDDWKFNYTNFTKSLGIGEKAVRTLLKKLEKYKYLKRDRLRDKNGQYEWNYFVFEEPYDMVLEKEKLPCASEGYMEKGDVVEGNIYQNTNITKDKKDKTYGLQHYVLIKELIDEEYIDDNDEQMILYDSLFDMYLKQGKTYIDLYSTIHYIAPRVVSRDFIDEQGKSIGNKFKYFEKAVKLNFNKLENYSQELYPEDDRDGR